MTLDKLPLGQEAVITAVGGEGALRCRLLDMGLIPEDHACGWRRSHPWATPLELRVRGYSLSLRKEDAGKIEVEVAGDMIFALAGNQNCGKTTLFNQLTGSNQHVGNFPGVTVDQKSGAIRGEKDCTVVDLPGIYSIRPYTPEEIVTRDFILNQKPDGLINIVDATNIERNLYLTLQLMEMRIPMVLALNMMDEVTAGGGTIDVKGMSQALGIPVVPISAVKNQGVDELVKIAVQTARNKTLPTVYDFCSPGPVHRCIHAVVHQIEDHAEKLRASPSASPPPSSSRGTRTSSTRLALDQNELELIEHSVKEMEDECGMDRNAALADMRYTFIESVCAGTVVKCRESRERTRS